jgi:putative component of membrane protein insertase Oxa1/YidC/SpoIIIJ protein YidD
VTPPRLLGVAVVRTYRQTLGRVPRTRRCLFRVSCSRHVEAVLVADGLAAGWRAFRRRAAACRPGYEFLFGDGGPAVRCASGTVVPLDELSETVTAEVRLVATALHAR